jgi:hypothetical protein
MDGDAFVPGLPCHALDRMLKTGGDGDAQPLDVPFVEMTKLLRGVERLTQLRRAALAD